MIPSLETLFSVGRQVGRWFGARPAGPSGVDDPQAIDAMRRAREAHQAGRLDETRTLYRYVLQRWPNHAGSQGTTMSRHCNREIPCRPMNGKKWSRRYHG